MSDKIFWFEELAYCLFNAMLINIFYLLNYKKL